jgi:hypothetical protein
VRCIESRCLVAIGVLVLSAACTSPPPTSPPTVPVPVVRPSSAAPVGAPNTSLATAGLGSPGAVRNWNELRLQAARRLVAANPGGTYVGTVPDLLLAIAVLEIELNADGSIRRIDVQRAPTQAKETVQLAIDAVRRSAPFGDVSRLPKPWKFSETFLFNDDRKFKPRTLDN